MTPDRNDRGHAELDQFPSQARNLVDMQLEFLIEMVQSQIAPKPGTHTDNAKLPGPEADGAPSNGGEDEDGPPGADP